MTEHAPEFRVNEEWRKYSDRSYRYPNQFGEAVLIPGVNCMEEEAQALAERGAIFPLEIAEPQRATFLTEQDEIFLPAKG